MSKEFRNDLKSALRVYLKTAGKLQLPKREKRAKDDEPKISLQDLLSKKPIPFSKKNQKKELDKEELKKALKASLEKEQKGKIEPGETIKF